jgi:hypothetical protein
MSVATASSPAPVPGVRDQDRNVPATPARSRWLSRIWVLVEALAYAGASIDPASALAAQRFARLRDEELGHGHR